MAGLLQGRLLERAIVLGMGELNRVWTALSGGLARCWEIEDEADGEAKLTKCT